MWLAVAQAGTGADGVEQLLPQLETIMRLTAELDARVSIDGVRGIEGVLALHARLEGALAAVATEDLDRMHGEIERLRRGLTELAHGLQEIARLKAALGV